MAPPAKKAKTGAVIYNDGLSLQDKVPSDIEIAQVCSPLRKCCLCCLQSATAGLG
jgi:hypothetical protein